MTELTAPTIIALVGTGIAAYTDARTGKIYNKLTGPLILIGLITNLIMGQPLVGLLGFLLATAIHMPTWFLQIQKGGDVKLIMGIGACMGWEFIVQFTLYYALLYLVVGFLALLVRGRLFNLYMLLSFHLKERIAAAREQGENGEPAQVHAFEATVLWTGPVIFGATLATLYFG